MPTNTDQLRALAELVGAAGLMLLEIDTCGHPVDPAYRATLHDAWTNGQAALASAPQPSFDRRFADMLIGILGDVQDELGFTDEEKLCANGSAEIVAAIRELKERALAQQPAPPSVEAVGDWVLVPRKPTLAMANAAWRDLESQGIDPEDVETPQVWDAMLAAAPQQPAAGEEIMVNAAHDVYTLPLQPSGLLSGPRFVVHVPAPEQQPAGVMPDGISDDVIKAVWRAAMTSAHNVCVNRSNRWNDDDGPHDRITEANECAKEIAHWLEADEGFIAEIRAMLAAQQQGGRADG